MAATVNSLITASTYNAIRSDVNRILGTGDGGEKGYGVALTSSSKVDNDIMYAADMEKLYNDIVVARTHQVGSPIYWTNAADGLDAPEAGDIVGVAATSIGPGGTSYSATAGTDEGYLDFENAVLDIVNDRYLVGPGQGSLSTIETSVRSSPWNTGINHSFTLTWANADERRYWFNTGGYILISANLTGGTSDPNSNIENTPPGTKDEIWQSMLNTMGSYKFSVLNPEVIGGTNPGTIPATGTYASGLYTNRSTVTDWSATSNDNRVILFQKEGSGVYSENLYRIVAWQTAANSLRFDIQFYDNDTGDDRSGDAGFPGEGVPVDENVTGKITSTIQARTSTGVIVKDLPTVTRNSNL
jgi:hypothetical protein